MLDLRKKLRDNDKFYVLYETFKRMNSPEFCGLIRSYYQNDYDGTVYMVEHPGTQMPQETIYDISEGEYRKDSAGLGATMHLVLYYLKIADEYNFIPRVVWGKGCPYYEPELENASVPNVFEYYFKPVSAASQYQSSDFKNVIWKQTKHILRHQSVKNLGYFADETDIAILAESYQKHVHLNAKTESSISEGIHKIFRGGVQKNVLGVHARGGDFKLELQEHPHPVPPEEYVAKAREIFTDGDYDNIFLATDDEDILKLFICEFGDSLLYYDDVQRIVGNTTVFQRKSDRPLHHYKMGLEVLRDVYTLASCQGLLCGLSQVSFMARYVKKSLGENFETLTILNNGINGFDGDINANAKA